MRGISGQSFLISHLVAFILFCLTASVGYGAILGALYLRSGEELTKVHGQLMSDGAFQDAFSASALSLSAIVSGWLAAKTSNAKPLLHGCLSSVAFFVFFAFDAFHRITHFSQLLTIYENRPLSSLTQFALPIFGLFGATIVVLTRKESSSPLDAP